MKTIYLDVTDSTNEYVKRHSLTDTVVIAGRQTGGRGTKGREFVSPEGGLYMSYVREYEGMTGEVFRIMTGACTAVCRTLETCSVTPVIRWPNDVLSRGRKISGTLIENTVFGNGRIKSVVGIGINVNNPLPESLRDTATSVKEETGRYTDLSRLADTLISCLSERYTADEYRSYINWTGKEIRVSEGGETYTAVALSVSDDGRLLVSRGGTKKLLSSAEVTIRL